MKDPMKCRHVVPKNVPGVGWVIQGWVGHAGVGLDRVGYDVVGHAWVGWGIGVITFVY